MKCPAPSWVLVSVLFLGALAACSNAFLGGGIWRSSVFGQFQFEMLSNEEPASSMAASHLRAMQVDLSGELEQERARVQELEEALVKQARSSAKEQVQDSFCPRGKDGALVTPRFPDSLVPETQPLARAHLDEGIVGKLHEDVVLCRKAWRQCEKLFNSSKSPLADYKDKDVIRTDPRVRGLPFMHLAKNGGTAVEEFLNLPHWGHNCMSRQKPEYRYSTGKYQRAHNVKSAHFFAVLRHPIERLVSDYHFKLSGEEQGGYEERQEQLCKKGTGRAFKKPCVPKVSLYEFGQLDDGPATSHGGRNHQWDCLRPENSTKTVGEVQDFLLSNAWVLVGTVDNMLEFQIMLAQIFGLDKRKIRSTRIKSSKHGQPEDLLTKQQYEDLVKLHWKDVTLYYWALRYHEMMRQCYGPQRLAKEVAEVKARR